MKRLLRIPEFLELYSISRTAFYREVSAGRLMLSPKSATRAGSAHEDAEAWARGASQVGCRSLSRPSAHRSAQDQDPPQLYGRGAGSRLLCCHKQSVRNWLKQGLPALEDGKRPA
jgi:hypothetical protein